MAEDIDVVVVGAGQAGLAVSHQLSSAGVEHVVLDQDAVGAAWRHRWDSLRLVTPNDTVRLPGGEYRGPDPDGFMPAADLVRHLEAYAAGFGAPVRTGVRVAELTEDDGRLRLETTLGTVLARSVVAATGAFGWAHRPAVLADLPPDLPVLEAGTYRSPGALPDGAVLVIGSGQTGCQIAEELRLAGRDVTLVCGRAPWVPRRIEGRDIVHWLLDTPFFDVAVADLPSPAARLVATPQNTGADGGHDLNHRTLAAIGVRLAGRIGGVEDGTAYLVDDLRESVAFGDARYVEIRALITRTCQSRGLPVPAMPDPPPFLVDGAEQLDLRGFGCVVVAAGYRPAYRRWIPRDYAFDAMGFPLQQDGLSDVIPGLYFAGVHFQRTRKSSLLFGVGEDAAIVAERIAEARSRTAAAQVR